MNHRRQMTFFLSLSVFNQERNPMEQKEAILLHLFVKAYCI